MKTFAFVPNVPGSVQEVFIGDELFPMHPDLASKWHEAPTGTSSEDHFDGVSFGKPPPAAQDDVRRARVAAIDALLLAIDTKKARALTDALLSDDKSRLESLEAEAEPLRAERRSLIS